VVFFDQGDIRTQLRRPDGGDVPPGAGSQYGDLDGHNAVLSFEDEPVSGLFRLLIDGKRRFPSPLNLFSFSIYSRESYPQPCKRRRVKTMAKTNAIPDFTSGDIDAGIIKGFII
jgi:hypothetical protein